MKQDYWVQKINHDGSPLGDPRPLYGDREQRMASEAITSEGTAAVAAALGIEFEHQPVKMSGLSPEVQLAEGLQQIAEGR